MSLSVAAIVPAYNEQEGLAETLRSLVNQSVRFDRIVVVDDCSTDGTQGIAVSFPEVTLVRPDGNLGSKAAAQSYGLSYCDEDIVITVDADTLLDADYVSHILPAFDNPKVAVAAGCVMTKNADTMWERGRQAEYLYGFHFYRPVQQAAKSPMVCSGCCSAFRRELLVARGGFPDRTIVEDMDYTWSVQRDGYRAVYVAKALAHAADPETFKFMRVQVRRWMHGFFQNVYIHGTGMWRTKKILALFIWLAIIEIIAAPLWYALPLMAWYMGWGFDSITLWFGVELMFIVPVIAYGAVRRKIPLGWALFNVVFVFVVKILNFMLAWKAMICELFFRKRWSLSTYEKGH